MKTINPTATLPRILAVLSKTDHGPCDPEPTAVCPHCGSDGRYVYQFLCEDGKVHGAMSGCIQLFPRHDLTAPVMAIMDKAAKYAKEKWNLPTWDQAIMDACSELAAQRIAFTDWERIIRASLASRTAFLNKKYGPRRRH